jgi:lipoprotein-anchoring transpeptidase ErfK/SrfK
VRNLVIIIVATALVIGLTSLVKKEKSPLTSVRKVEVVTLEERQQKKIKNLQEKALTYKQAGEMKESMRTWRELVKIYPTSLGAAQAFFELFVYFTKENKPEYADEYFSKIAQDFPKSNYFPLALYERAKAYDKNKEYVAAQRDYRRLVKEFFFFEHIADAQKRMENVTMRLLFSRKLMDGAQYYKVKGGDSLYTIAKKLNTTIDYLIAANGLKRKSVIHPGDRIKVLSPKTKLSVSIDKSQKTMFLKINGEIVKRYDVAIGRDDYTPVGHFAIQNKLKDPVWFNGGKAIPPDDPRNVLGSRWMGFDRDLGIHGTVDKKNILDQTSNGCIRMYNEDVEQLYKLLRVGDPVIIVE